MKRYAWNFLKNWKNSNDRKPLILWGARQVGKTWLMKEFGKEEYKDTLYINFDTTPIFCDYFKDDISPDTIIKSLEIHFHKKIDPENTLIIFDEIQECQRAKDTLKYFNELAPQYNIISAGSFLGVSTGKFPVGQVDNLTLYPMSFYEFLEANGEEQLLSAIKEKKYTIINNFTDRLKTKLKEYYYIGGMPEVVNNYIKDKDLEKVRETQNQILQEYRNDFSKHISTKDIAKVRMLWDSIPVHLAREKKKFIYKDIKVGGRASEFENALNWLINTGLVYKISKIFTPNIPLARNEEKDIFKLFMLDTGLLCAKANIDISSFYLENKNIFSDFCGAITEQYVCQELKSQGFHDVFYWGNKDGKSEVDFLIQNKSDIIPIEAKSETNTKAKSLKVYVETYKPNIIVKTSMNMLGIEDNKYSIPLYLIESLKNIVEG